MGAMWSLGQPGKKAGPTRIGRANREKAPAYRSLRQVAKSLHGKPSTRNERASSRNIQVVRVKISDKARAGQQQPEQSRLTGQTLMNMTEVLAVGSPHPSAPHGSRTWTGTCPGKTLHLTPKAKAKAKAKAKPFQALQLLLRQVSRIHSEHTILWRRFKPQAMETLIRLSTVGSAADEVRSVRKYDCPARHQILGEKEPLRFHL